MDFLDEFLVLWYYYMVFMAFVGLAWLLGKIFDKCPKFERFVEKMLDIDLSDDEENGTETNIRL